jgi:hypothetical protein
LILCCLWSSMTAQLLKGEGGAMHPCMIQFGPKFLSAMARAKTVVSTAVGANVIIVM